MLAKIRKNRQQKSSQGFTIIEVMIVLAIAGLILLIVFLAVPALQRSARNTQRKTDIGRIGSAATTVLSNNNNNLSSLTTASLTNEIGSGLSYYQTSQVSVGTPTSTPTNTTTTNSVVVYPGAVCAAISTGGQGATTTNAQNTSIAITYSTETGGTADLVCNNE